jgi:hypothetical protein
MKDGEKETEEGNTRREYNERVVSEMKTQENGMQAVALVQPELPAGKEELANMFKKGEKGKQVE